MTDREGRIEDRIFAAGYRMGLLTRQICQALGVDPGKHETAEAMLEACRDVILKTSVELEDFRCRWCKGKVRRYLPSPVSDMPDELIGHAFRAPTCAEERRRLGHEVPTHGRLTEADLEPIP